MHSKHIALPALTLILLAGRAQGGPLTPPPGAVAPNMVPLSVIEPGIIVNDLPGDAECMHRIIAPGRYVFSVTVSVSAGRSGIIVDIPPGVSGTVEIDLNGFSIQGEPGSFSGIVYRNNENCHWSISCPNGSSISGVGGDGIHIEGGATANIDCTVRHCGDDGIDVSNTPTCMIGAVSRFAGKYLVQGCTHRGLNIAGCGTVDISGLDASENGEHGISIENTGFVRIRDTDSNRNDGAGLRFVNLTTQAKVAAEKADIGTLRCTGNTGGGMVLDSVGDVSVVGSSFSSNLGDGASVRHDPLNRPAILNFTCEFTNNDLHGARLIWSPRSNVSLAMDECRAFANGGAGMDASWETDAPGATPGRVAISLKDSIFDGNGLDGCRVNRDRSKTVDMRAEDCSFSGNTRDGLKTYFETGDIPTEDQFANLIDSRFNRNGFIGINCQTKNITVSACEASSNGEEGLKFQTNSPGHKTVCEINLRANLNEGTGIAIIGPIEATLRDCETSHNGRFSSVPRSGTLAVSVEGIRAVGLRSAGNSGDGLTIADLDRDGYLDAVACSGNTGSGISVQTYTGTPCGRLSMHQCVAQSNGMHGLDLHCSSGSDVRECVFRGNGGLGASASGVGHVFVWNTAADNALGPYFIPVPGNSVGPAIEEPFMLTDEHPHANFVR